MKSLVTIILSLTFIKSTTSMSCNVEEYQDTRWTKIICSQLTSPSEIQFSYKDDKHFKKVLSIVDSNISTLPPKGFWRFSTIIELWLTGNQIQELEERSFDRMLNVEQIYVNQNQLTEIPEGVFTSDLKQLEYLNMEKNKIEKVSQNAFKDVTSLKFLHLKENKIAKLEKGTFADLTTLRSLGLSWNSLTKFKDYELFGNSTSNRKNLSHNLRFLLLDRNKIASFVVKNLKQLQWIGLAFNNLSHLEPDSFAEMPELQDLDLSNNFIKILPNQLLRGNIKLEFIKMSNNSISVLERGVFQDLFQLFNLDLRNNLLTKFHDFDLWGNSENIVNVSKNLRDIRLRKNLITSVSLSNCKAVRNVYLNYNKLSHLKPDIIKDLPNMTELDISNNPLVEALPQQLFQGAVRLQKLSLNNLTIAKLPCGIFKDLKDLKRLELNYNRLGDFKDCCLFGDSSNSNFSCRNKLTDLFLHHNLISSFTLISFPNLEYVDLADNNISSVRDSDFGGLHNLKSLNLSNNIINEISPTLLKDNENLLALNLGSNKINKLKPGTFSNQNHLSHLNLSNNLLAEFIIADLWKGFGGDLKTLDLSKNLIKTFRIFSKNLQSISLANNNISFMRPGTFRDMHFLSTIDLSHNNINRIPLGVFQNLTNLQDLDLSNNILRKFDHQLLSGKTNPKNLDLSNNQIASFNIEKLKEHLTNLISISLVNNLFKCDALAQLEYQLQNLDVALVKGEAIDVQNIAGIACDDDEDY